MGTKKVEVWLTRNYCKQVKQEVEVDENLKGEELERFIRNDKMLMDELEERLYYQSLFLEDDELEVME